MSEDWTTSAATPVPTMRDRIISGTPEHGDSTRPTRRDTGVTPRWLSSALSPSNPALHVAEYDEARSTPNVEGTLRELM